jgi:hypothetical protein
MGLAAWGYGAHPLHVLAAAARRLPDRPAGLCGAAYVLGYLRAALRRAPRGEAELRAYVRRAQLRRLSSMLSDGRAGTMRRSRA